MEQSKEIADLAERIQDDFHRQIDRLFSANKKLKRVDLFATCVYLKLAELETRISVIEKRILNPKQE